MNPSKEKCGLCNSKLSVAVENFMLECLFCGSESEVRYCAFINDAGDVDVNSFKINGVSIHNEYFHNKTFINEAICELINWEYGNLEKMIEQIDMTLTFI